VQYIKEKYWEYEYQEVVTPNMFNLELWHTSGHAAHYKVAFEALLQYSAPSGEHARITAQQLHAGA
jgi:threonyl-tRNA synthetase